MWYKCNLSSKNPYGTNVYCQKNGLKVTACEDCWGEGCKNAEEIFDDNEEIFNAKQGIREVPL